jgi:DNA invertase Pin-like site-specific DNA recombinase
MADRLVDLGWPRDQVRVIDQDLGKTGKDPERDGFQALVAEVSNGLVGAVASLECSRLARESEAWIRLTKFCAFTNTLLIDADGIYDPNNFNDRLLLGLKGTMNEAELHFLQERMYGALLSKAERGELRRPIPAGYVYDDKLIVKDPDAAVQEAVGLLFDVFRRAGSAHRVVEHFRKNGLEFPRSRGKGFYAGVEWLALDYATVLRVLHNPVYAGVYCYGRKQSAWTPGGKQARKMPREEWHAFRKDSHEPYITFEEFENNERIIDGNRLDTKCKRERTPPREGPSLLQGLVYCGKCGCSMRVSYQKRAGRMAPVYRCDQELHNHRGSLCQSVPGLEVDAKIAELLVSRLTPEAVALAVSVQKELDGRQAQTLSFFQLRVDKCEYEAGLARRRYMGVDPDNRLVAFQLEVSWNKALKELDDARARLAEQAEALEKTKNERDFRQVEGLPGSFAEAFNSDSVSSRDKKRMARYLIEDVTLLKADQKILIQARLKGGATQVIEIDAPLPATKLWTTDPEVVNFIDAAAENYCDEEIADLLNCEGHKTGKGFVFNKINVRSIMRLHSIPNKKKRHMDRGYVTVAERAGEMGISIHTLYDSIHRGKYQGEYIRVNKSNELLFPPLADS